MKIIPILALTMFSSVSLKAQTNAEALFKINAEVMQHSEAYQQLEKATVNVGPRTTGTKNGRLAEEYAATLLKDYGYDVTFQEFEFKGWNRQSLAVKIDGEEVKSVALAHSPAVADVSGEIVFLGNGLKEDYNKLRNSLNGKIVLVALGLIEDTPKGTKNLHRSEKTALAAEYGAKGIILYNQAKGDILLTGTASVTGEIIDIPAVNITYEEGHRILDKLQNKPMSAQIKMKNEVGPMKARNIIARRVGTELPNEKIVLGGHLDSWDLATGAIDNGVGSFSIIDVARTLKKLNLPHKRTIEFVLFMGEEVGLLGSKHYVKTALKDGSIHQIKAMSNMDMTTNPKVYYASTDETLAFLDQLALDIQAYIPDFKEKSIQEVGLHSDHQPFMLEGIPIIGLGESQFKKGALNCYHADCDTFDFVEEIGLKNNVITQTYLLHVLSNEKDLPAKRWTDDEIKAQLIKGNLETPLRISGDWRWK